MVLVCPDSPCKWTRLQNCPHFHTSFSSQIKRQELLVFNPKHKRCNTSTHPKMAQFPIFLTNLTMSCPKDSPKWEPGICQAQGSNVPMRLSMARCFSFTSRVNPRISTMLWARDVGVSQIRWQTCLVRFIVNELQNLTIHPERAHLFNLFSKIPS